MITPNNSNNLFTASEYEPNPNSTMYWIDLTQNSRGNVIKTFDGKRWLPLNRAANVDQWAHISEIVKAAGIDFSESADVITFPSNESNHYFTGKNITDTIANGDSEVYDEITALWKKVNSVDTFVATIDNFTNTADKVTLNGDLWAPSADGSVFEHQSDITLDLPTVTDGDNAGVMTGGQYHGLLTKDTELSNQITALQTRVGSLETKVQSLESQYNTLNTTVSNLQSRISTLESA